MNITEEIGVSAVDNSLEMLIWNWKKRGALEPPFQYFLIILYTFTGILSLIGNVIVIFVMRISQRCARNFRKFLINLAISDLLIGVFCVPFTYTHFMLQKWIFSTLLCPIAEFILLSSGFVTAFTLTAIGIERYIATICPLSGINLWLKTHCSNVLIFSWVISWCLALIPTMHTRVTVETFENETIYKCVEEWTGLWEKMYSGSTFVLTFFLPMIIMIICYGSIGKKMLNYRSPPNSNASIRKRSQLVTKYKAVEMMITVVFLFVFCWMPIKSLMLMYSFWPQTAHIETMGHYYFFIISYFVSHWLSMAHSFVNPLVYCFMSKGFRADLCDFMSQLFGHYARKHCAEKISM